MVRDVRGTQGELSIKTAKSQSLREQIFRYIFLFGKKENRQCVLNKKKLCSILFLARG